MNFKELITASFDKNVGTVDRVFRLVGGVGVAAAGWLLALPSWASAALVVAGAMSFVTGVLSKCSIYYLMGYSTCPVGGEPSARRSA